MKRYLRAVARTAEARERSEAALAAAIVAAREAGASYRQIADATGNRLSHESIRTIAKRGGGAHAR